MNEHLRPSFPGSGGYAIPSTTSTSHMETLRQGPSEKSFEDESQLRTR